MLRRVDKTEDGGSGCWREHGWLTPPHVTNAGLRRSSRRGKYVRHPYPRRLWCIRPDVKASEADVGTTGGWFGAALAHHGQSETGQAPRPVSLARFHPVQLSGEVLPLPLSSSCQTTSTPTVFSPHTPFLSTCTSSFGCFLSHQLRTPFTSPSPAPSSLASLLWKRGHKAMVTSLTMSSPPETRQKISSRSIIPHPYH